MKNYNKLQVYTLVLFLAESMVLYAQTPVYDTGGPLMPEQSWYDITSYEIHLSIHTDQHSIDGYVDVSADILTAMDMLVLNLDSRFMIDSVQWIQPENTDTALDFTHEESLLNISFPDSLFSDDEITVRVTYSGIPREAPGPPWDGGFNWSQTSTGDPWVGLSCEGEGADVWIPCKDHPSDEPDSVDLYLTVPAELMCVSNGKLVDISEPSDSIHTFHWFVSTPINNYCITLNIAPFVDLNDTYISSAGDSVSTHFYLLPQSQEAGAELFDDFNGYLQFFESYFGPYPFRTEKYALVQTDYLGMEHQTAVSYGSVFTDNNYGFDYILVHESAHEWWGNLVTAEDWKDIWIHESFATYAEALCAEYLNGKESYHSYVSRWGTMNQTPIAPETSHTFDEMYNIDIYHKGALVLHTLRYLLGDDVFFTALRRMAYPDTTLESVTTGEQCRLEDTDGIIAIAETVAGQELDWFFDVYLRQPDLPTLRYSTNETILSLRWDTPGNIPFYMPVDIAIGNDTIRVEMDDGSGSILIGNEGYEIDPRNWILKSGIQLETGQENPTIVTEYKLYPNYPNPFNPRTMIRFNLPAASHVNLVIFDLMGREVKSLVDDLKPAGQHRVTWIGEDNTGRPVSAGVYLCQLSAGAVVQSHKMILLK